MFLGPYSLCIVAFLSTILTTQMFEAPFLPSGQTNRHRHRLDAKLNYKTSKTWMHRFLVLKKIWPKKRFYVKNILHFFCVQNIHPTNLQKPICSHTQTRTQETFRPQFSSTATSPNILNLHSSGTNLGSMFSKQFKCVNVDAEKQKRIVFCFVRCHTPKWKTP